MRPSTLQARKAKLAVLIRECLGKDILQEAQAVPGWRYSLEAARERLACRWARQTA